MKVSHYLQAIWRTWRDFLHEYKYKYKYVIWQEVVLNQQCFGYFQLIASSSRAGK